MGSRQPSGDRELQSVERILARGFVAAGGVFWFIAAFAAPYVYSDMTLPASLRTAMWPFLATVATLVIGWYSERLAALLLFTASAAVFVWGTLYEWELGMWLLMSFVLIAPMTFAGILFILSARADSRRELPADEE